VDRARVLYDKPPEYFQRLEEKERERFLIKLEERGLVPDLSSFFGSGPAKWARNARPFIIVTSTSYTEDENLQILIDAINDVDSKLHCKLLVFITGKGPLYNFYRDRIAMLNNTLRKCRVYQVWLPFEDYPLLLGSSDLGVSLHFSSSGLDLPMKIVDMFGCGLPVCSMKFPCIGELVHEGKNGYLFSSSQELSPLLLLLTKGYPSPNPELIRLGAGVLESSCFKKRWRQNWNEVAQSTFYQSV
jgi:beta-1,4-mannosyltransferase